MKSGAKITVDNFASIIRAISEIAKKDVLIGIPDSAPERDDTPMTNAQIGYVMETGSPAHNVPARPFLVPAVADVQSECADKLKEGASAALDGNEAAAIRALNVAGMIAEQSVKKKIGSNIPPPLSPETIRNRNRSRKTTSMRANEKEYLKAVDSGTDPGVAQEAAGIVALVNSGQLRNTVTHVIRDKK
jgi:hypothetical protein